MKKPFSATLLMLALSFMGCGETADPNAKYPDGVAPNDEASSHLGDARSGSGPTSAEEIDLALERSEETHTAQGLVYTVPIGWSVGAARQMRVLTIDAGDGVEVAVAKWPTGIGDIESNLTRWYGFAGYNPADAAQIEQARAGFETFQLGDARATWIPLLDGDPTNGSPMIGVWVPRGENPTAQSETWTFKITGDAETLRDKEAALRAWTESLRFE